MTPTLLLMVVSLPPDGGASDVPGLGRVVGFGHGVYAGPSPADWAAVGLFDAVICVDSLPPAGDATFAPTPYSGLSSASKAAAAAARGRVYVYCHRGRHRGPSVAAWLARLRGLSDRQARATMKRAGVGQEFPGLWRDALGGLAVPEASPVEVSTVRRAMAELDRLRESSGSDRETLIAEAFREAARDPNLKPQLRAELTAASRGGAGERDCSACHRRWADRSSADPEMSRPVK